MSSDDCKVCFILGALIFVLFALLGAFFSSSQELKILRPNLVEKIKLSSISQSESNVLAPVLRETLSSLRSESHAEFSFQMQNNAVTDSKFGGLVFSTEGLMIQGTPFTYLFEGFTLSSKETAYVVISLVLPDPNAAFKNSKLVLLDKDEKFVCEFNIQQEKLFEYRLEPLLETQTLALSPNKRVKLDDYYKESTLEVAPSLELYSQAFAEKTKAQFLFRLTNEQDSVLKIGGFIISNENRLINGEASTFFYEGFNFPPRKERRIEFSFPVQKSDTTFTGFSVTVLNHEHKIIKKFDFDVPVTLFEHRLDEILQRFSRPIKVLILGHQGVAKSSLVNTFLGYLIRSAEPINIVQVGDVATGDATTLTIRPFGKDSISFTHLENEASPALGMFEFYDTPGIRKEGHFLRENHWEVLLSGKYNRDWDLISDPKPSGTSDRGEVPDVVLLCVPYSSLESIRPFFDETGRHIANAASKLKIPMFLGVTMLDEAFKKGESRMKRDLEQAKELFKREILLLDTYPVDAKRNFRTDLRSQEALIKIANAVSPIQLRDRN